jgi:hypothetical protein
MWFNDGLPDNHKVAVSSCFIISVTFKNSEDTQMKRITINALVDVGCLITFIPSLISGLVLYFVLPTGGGQGSGRILFLGIARNQWVTMHDCTSLFFF